MLNSILFSIALMLSFITIELIYTRDLTLLKKAFYLKDILYFFLYGLILSPIIFIFSNLLFQLTIHFTGGVFDLGIKSLWMQVLVTILIADFVNYFMHRAFHGKYLWPFHRTHHVADKLYWGKSYVTHPVESIISFVPSFYVVTMLGLTGESLAYSLLIINFYSIWGHSRVDISYGYLDSLFLSPKAHHIHHRREKDSRSKNIASFFSIFDIIFGSFEKPNKQVFEYGSQGERWDSFYEQIIGPFKMIRGKKNDKS